MDILRHLSPNADSRGGQPIDILVLHYTGMETADAALQRLCDPLAEVSAHYLIEEGGRTFQLVDEGERAWHAGVASWQGDTRVNARSIGIELVNPGHEFGYQHFPDAQMQRLIALSQDILSRHNIPARNIVGHSDVAPRRKMDPGELFNWQLLAVNGIGLWPADDGREADGDRLKLLSEIGYDIEDIAATLTAFQRRFCPNSLTGLWDMDTERKVRQLAAMI